jgi:hypothetical protein
MVTESSEPPAPESVILPLCPSTLSVEPESVLRSLTPSTPPSPLTLAVSLFALSFALSFAAEASASAASKNDTVVVRDHVLLIKLGRFGLAVYLISPLRQARAGAT